jgi:hypothetical protein
LAQQVRQNNRQLEVQSYQSWVAANLELNMAATDQLSSQALAQGAADSSKLSAESFICFAMWYMGVMQMAQATDYLYRSGSLDEELWRAEINRAAGLLTLPGVRQWWDAGAKTQLTPTFVRLLESSRSEITTWTWKEGRGFVSFSGPSTAT